MPQFILLCRDNPDSLELRMATRPAHLEYFEKFGNKAVLGGPLLDGDGKPKGSMLLIEADDEDAAREIAAADPYAKAGLFASVEVIPFRTVIANYPKG
jgi:uncharacterized protein